jgi:hypothetical protein
MEYYIIITEEIGKRIAITRKKLCLSRSFIAPRIGITPKELCSIENGNGIVTHRMFEALNWITGISEEEFRNGFNNEWYDRVIEKQLFNMKGYNIHQLYSLTAFKNFIKNGTD